MDSSFAGGEREAHAGEEESVRKDSLPPPPVLVELFPEPNSKPLNLENFFQLDSTCRVRKAVAFSTTHLIEAEAQAFWRREGGRKGDVRWKGLYERAATPERTGVGGRDGRIQMLVQKVRLKAMQQMRSVAAH
jgi:hypothetical protein